MEERISIIVPVYNAAPYIAHTIDMVCAQTYKDWELILVNDCSSDDSLLAIEKRIASDFTEQNCQSNSTDGTEQASAISKRCFVHQGGQRILLIDKYVNEGAARARNTGLREASGRYIAFLDADDVWLSEKLAKEMAFMKEKEAGFVFSAYEFGDEEANPTGKVVHVPETLSYKKALSRTIIFTTTVLMDRQMIPENLMYMPVVASEDTATWWQILKEGYVAYGLDEVLAIYRRPAKSLSSNKMVAIRRIWYLYRKQQKLPIVVSAFYFVQWAYRATVRRI